MKKNLLTLLFLLSVFTLSAQTKGQLFLKNSTDKVISELYISSSSTDFWGNQMLAPEKQFLANEVIKISLNIEPNDLFYDIKAICQDGSTFLLFENKMSSRTNVILNAKDFDSKITPAEKENLPKEVKESMSVKSGLPKKYKNGYKQGYLNGYNSGFQSGYEAALAELKNTSPPKATLFNNQ